MVVALLSVRSLPIPETPGLNPVTSTIIYCKLFVEKTKINKKRLGEVNFFKKITNWKLQKLGNCFFAGPNEGARSMVSTNSGLGPKISNFCKNNFLFSSAKLEMI